MADARKTAAEQALPVPQTHPADPFFFRKMTCAAGRGVVY